MRLTPIVNHLKPPYPLWVAIPGRLVLAAMACAVAVAVFGWLLRGDLDRPLVQHDQKEKDAVKSLRDVRIDTANPPVAQVAVDYSEGSQAAWWPQGEPPVIAAAIAREAKAGTPEAERLPPVAERVGNEPLVLAGPEGIGHHGGSWYRVANGPNDVGVMAWRLSGATLVRWSPQGYPIRPHMAKSWERNDDASIWTIHLRAGHRWSDGEPFTAEDIVFWFEHDVLHYNYRPQCLQTTAGQGRVEMVDATTVRFVFPEPNGLFLEALAREHTYALPAHYLRPYHPELGDPELIEAKRIELKLKSADGVYGRLKSLNNPEMPRLWPWILRTHRTTPPYTYVRNPYFCAVDGAGNQLPYLDRVVFDVKDAKMIPIAAASGEVTFQLRNIFYKDHTLLMGNRGRNGYEVYHWYPGTRSEWTLFPCINRQVDPAQPETRWKQQLLADKRFRQALSLAIDRKDIIEAEYNEQTEPAQIDPGPDSRFHSPELYRSFTAHDPQRARDLLDAIGLTERDGEGMRTAPDGTRLTFYINVCEFTGPGPAQFVIDDWAKIGVRAVLRDRARPLFYAEKAGFDHDFTVWTAESDFTPLVSMRNFVPTNPESFYAPRYGIWYARGGLYGDPKSKETPGALAPPADHPLREAMVLYDHIRRTADPDQQQELFAQIQAIAAENVWTISICTPPPQLVVVDEDLHNVPRVALSGAAYATPANAAMETWYHADPQVAEQSFIEISRQMTEIITERGETAAVGGAVTDDGGSGWFGTVIMVLVWGSLLAALSALCVRHPFVLRRLLLMIPTLLIVSIVVFTIIQLPPGDFLSAKITELEMQGDEAALRAIETKKRIYHYNEPAITKYFRWLGLAWFTSFEAGDEGLLQGNLGYSMETDRQVNEMVGDRILLTMAITLATVIFTWVVALGIGIYSAVRQYTLTDYTFTFLAMIGMCVPNFLLAILLIYLGDVWFGVTITGLFSPEYAAMPGWSWGKLLNLLAHIWLPVVVLGVGGTAGMMRIMRGNLLDELRKPYVTTARAKGVRPTRLLMKYPVRIALNPFISGIGGLFPQLVSGSAIVAMVLALPTVGPLMLGALTNQDMYLAGSMLMVMSLLAIFGTLISDLLLLWLDPRIRMDSGGTR
ncbi:MAG: ABC transporter substrate-binding protein [Planctomycetota bacterium]